MNKCILILLINLAGIFAANAKYCTDHANMVSRYMYQDKFNGEIEPTQIDIVSSGIIEGENCLTIQFTPSNNHLHYGHYSIYRQCKSDITTDNINLLPFIRKDIHFLSVLLI